MKTKTKLRHGLTFALILVSGIFIILFTLLGPFLFMVFQPVLVSTKAFFQRAPELAEVERKYFGSAGEDTHIVAWIDTKRLLVDERPRSDRLTDFYILDIESETQRRVSDAKTVNGRFACNRGSILKFISGRNEVLDIDIDSTQSTRSKGLTDLKKCRTLPREAFAPMNSENITSPIFFEDGHKFMLVNKQMDWTEGDDVGYLVKVSPSTERINRPGIGGYGRPNIFLNPDVPNGFLVILPFNSGSAEFIAADPENFNTQTPHRDAITNGPWSDKCLTDMNCSGDIDFFPIRHKRALGVTKQSTVEKFAGIYLVSGNEEPKLLLNGYFSYGKLSINENGCDVVAIDKDRFVHFNLCLKN